MGNEKGKIIRGASFRGLFGQAEGEEGKID